jgi:LAO/AO transport system kinase
MVAGMVDCFLVLMLAGAGDELQGIKRGILEFADLVAINNADGDNMQSAARAQVEYARALHLMPRKSQHWTVPILTCSGLNGDGLAALWGEIERFRVALEASGEWEKNRAQQRVQAMWRAIEWGVVEVFRAHEGVQARVREMEVAVREGRVAPDHAAVELLSVFRAGA